MGNWNINIQGIGAHHNLNNPTDANLMADRFVAELKAAGHVVESATFTYGAKQPLTGSVEFGATEKGVSVDVEEKVNEHFSVGGGVSKDFDGDTKAQVKGKITW